MKPLSLSLLPSQNLQNNTNNGILGPDEKVSQKYDVIIFTATALQIQAKCGYKLLQQKVTQQG